MKKNNKRKRKKKAYRRNCLIGIMAVLVIIISGFVTYYYNYIRYWNNLIYPGVVVEGIDLSGKTREQALNIMKQKFYGDLNNRNIVIKAEGKSYTMNCSKLKAYYNIEDTVNQAFSYGKKLDLVSKYESIKNPKAVNYKLKLSYDEKTIQALVNQIQSEVDKNAVDATITLSNGFNVVPEKNGTKLESDKLLKEIKDKLSEDSEQNVLLDAPIQVVKARINADYLKNVNTKIGSFSTNYGSISSPQRANNIIIAAKSIDGTVLLPGEVFSFNNVVGERTGQKGYEAAPVIVGNKLESGLGGGVCQVSTTLYNAVADAGIPSTERSKHSMPVHYVAQGMDATVSYGSLDYKFKNIFNYAIYIQSYTSGGVLTFNIYSNASVKK